MSAAGVIYDTVGTVESAVSRTRVWRRLCWLAEDVRAVWSAMSAIPWTGADEPVRVPWGTDGYQPPGLERILPDPQWSTDVNATYPDRDAALRATDRRVDRATPDELDRLLDEILADAGQVIHACPPIGSGVTPCCGRTPFELPGTDRLSLFSHLVTCDRGDAA